LYWQTRRKSSREKDKGSDGDSSVCEELIEEPVIVKEELTNKEQTSSEDRCVKLTSTREQQYLLVDHIAHSMIGYWRDTVVRLSVHL